MFENIKLPQKKKSIMKSKKLELIKLFDIIFCEHFESETIRSFVGFLTKKRTICKVTRTNEHWCVWQCIKKNYTLITFSHITINSLHNPISLGLGFSEYNINVQYFEITATHNVIRRTISLRGGAEVSLKIDSLHPKYIIKWVYSVFWSVKIPCKQIPEGSCVCTEPARGK